MTCMCAQAFSVERASYRVRLGGGERKNLLATRTDSVQLFAVKEVRVVSWPTGLVGKSPKSRIDWKLLPGTGRNQSWDRCFRSGLRRKL